MSPKDPITRESKPQEIHLVGIGLGHTLTPPAHNFVAYSIDVPWRITATECPTISDCVRILRSPNTGGGVVTMPWKSDIIPHLDRLDDVAKTLNAVNVVYFNEDGEMCGSNVDWVGIEGALRAELQSGVVDASGGTAAVIGAGGAARAAIYALTFSFGIKVVYVVNRDDDEVTQLLKDCSQMPCKLLHVKSGTQAEGLDPPSLIIGCAPDFEAVTSAEKEAKSTLKSFLERKYEKGVMVDMCYHPTPQTRNLALAAKYGWRTVRGVEVVGHQVEALWRFWIRKERLGKLDREGMWKTLREAVRMDSAGRQALNKEILERHFGDRQ